MVSTSQKEDIYVEIPGDMERNQIDYILVKHRYRNAEKNSRAYPEGNTDADHNLVLMENEIRLTTIKKCKARKKWNTTR